MNTKMTFDDHVAARTIWGECRGESYEGKLAVAHVIRNRVRRGSWGKTVAAVCLASFQFSAWNINDPNRRKMLELDDDDPVLLECVAAWFNVGADPTSGACHYRVTGSPASWAEGETPVCTIGAHEFFVGIK